MVFTSQKFRNNKNIAKNIHPKTRTQTQQFKAVQVHGSKAELSCGSSRGQQVMHQRRIWWIHCALAIKDVSKSIHSTFETQRRHHQKSKTGVSVAIQKKLMSSKIFFNKLEKKFKTAHKSFFAWSAMVYFFLPDVPLLEVVLTPSHSRS